MDIVLRGVGLILGFILDGTRRLITRTFKDLRSCNKPYFILFCSCLVMFLRALTGAGYDNEEAAQTIAPSSWAKWGQVLNSVEWAQNNAPHFNHYVHEFLEKADKKVIHFRAGDKQEAHRERKKKKVKPLSVEERRRLRMMQSDLEKELRGLQLATFAEEEENQNNPPLAVPPEEMNLDNDGIDPPQYLDDDEDELLHPFPPEEPDSDDLDLDAHQQADGWNKDEGFYGDTHELQNVAESEDTDDLEDTDEDMDPPTHAEHHLPDGKERLRKVRRSDGDGTS